MLTNNLVQTITQDDFILSGLLVSAQDSKTACIFIHGFTGDFYTHKFPQVIASRLKELGISTLLAQNRGTGLHTEIVKSNREDFEYIGSFYEKIEDAHLDISGWIKYLKNIGYEKFILMGHSFGTLKSVRYLFEGEYSNDIEKLILLGVYDKNWFVVEKAGVNRAAHLNLAKERIDQGRGKELVTSDMEDFPLTFETYYSTYKDEEINNMFDFHRKDNYDFPTLKSINTPTFVALGSEDREFVKDITEVKPIIEENVPKVTFEYIEGADHGFKDREEILAQKIVDFVQN